jgi:hypothetical protein
MIIVLKVVFCFVCIYVCLCHIGGAVLTSQSSLVTSQFLQIIQDHFNYVIIIIIIFIMKDWTHYTVSSSSLNSELSVQRWYGLPFHLLHFGVLWLVWNLSVNHLSYVISMWRNHFVWCSAILSTIINMLVPVTMLVCGLLSCMLSLEEPPFSCFSPAVLLLGYSIVWTVKILWNFKRIGYLFLFYNLPDFNWINTLQNHISTQNLFSWIL